MVQDQEWVNPQQRELAAEFKRLRAHAQRPGCRVCTGGTGYVLMVTTKGLVKVACLACNPTQ